jgi:hypothetical protein
MKLWSALLGFACVLVLGGFLGRKHGRELSISYALTLEQVHGALFISPIKPRSMPTCETGNVSPNRSMSYRHGVTPS